MVFCMQFLAGSRDCGGETAELEGRDTLRRGRWPVWSFRHAVEQPAPNAAVRYPRKGAGSKAQASVDALTQAGLCYVRRTTSQKLPGDGCGKQKVTSLCHGTTP